MHCSNASIVYIATVDVSNIGGEKKQIEEHCTL